MKEEEEEEEKKMAVKNNNIYGSSHMYVYICRTAVSFLKKSKGEKGKSKAVIWPPYMPPCQLILYIYIYRVAAIDIYIIYVWWQP